MNGDRGAALADLGRARRHHRLATVDWFDSFYHAYLTALGVGVAIIVGSTYIPDEELTAAGAALVAREGPAPVGLGIAVLVALGLRSGGRGGPLSLEAPTVAHVLLAPVDRSAALRAPAVRQLRFGAYAGALVGGVAGLLAARRLPIDPYASVLCGAMTGALVALGAVGAALVVSGRRASPAAANLVALAVVGVAVADLVAGTALAPSSALARLALWPLTFEPVALAGVALALGLAALGLAGVGGTSLEAARRRAGLVSELRFAVTLQDLRTVVLLRRRLAQERPRGRPWFRLPASRGNRLPVLRRDLAGILRFPATRVLRLIVLGVVAGLALGAAWAGTSTLVVLAGVALYVAALDAVEPLAQEVDHPDRWAGFPLDAGGLLLRHLGASVVVVVAVAAVTAGTAAALGPASVVVPLAITLVLPVSLAATAAAAASTSQGLAQPKATSSAVPEFAGMALVLRNAWPPALVVVSLLPVLAARGAVADGLSPAPVAAATASIPVLFTGIALLWLSQRAPARL
ncbi:hypothetical protein BH24ACT2_BH24ACT2_09790 [soil metagenome]|nr:hypothetical protein [Acidimicrobiia bacterium]